MLENHVKNKSMTPSSCMVLLSGGQDSSTCLYWAKRAFKQVHAITFRYGQRHAHETEIAIRMANIAEVAVTVKELSPIFADSQNALTQTHIDIQESTNGTLPNTFVPGRNLLFLTIAAMAAYEKGIHNLVIGVSQTDYSGYPDCREPFIRSAEESLSRAMEYPFTIHTPLMWLDKEKTWALADELGVFDLIRQETLTCYNGIPAEGCGHCPACKLRKQGLEHYLRNRSQATPNTAILTRT
ncbi:MAG: 7-cyano-7-deazaguanine synthase QueC [Bacteroidales bacterium]